MKAIEFFTTAKNGKSIEIPKEYTKEISGEIHIIVLLNKKAAPKTPKSSTKKAFNALKLKTKGVKFNREDIYRRYDKQLIENSFNYFKSFLRKI